MNKLPVKGDIGLALIYHRLKMVRQVSRNLNITEFTISKIFVFLKAVAKNAINIAGLIITIGIFKWRRTTLKDAKRVLVIHSAYMGDILFLTPTLRAIKESFPKIKIYLVLWQRYAPVLENNAHVEKILWMENFGAKMLKENNIDHVIDYTGTFRTVFACVAAGVNNVVGFSQQGLGFLMSKVFSKRTNSHLSDMYYRVALSIGVGNTNQTMEYNVSDTEKEWADNFLSQHSDKYTESPPVIIHPGAGWAAKEWQPELYRELMRQVSKEFNVSFIIVGSIGELKSIETLLPQNGDNFKAGICTDGIREISSLIEQAELFIGSDSGFGHIAEALGTQSVLLYGPTNPIYSSPKNEPRHIVLVGSEPCQPVRAQYCLTDAGRKGCKTFACIRNISVDLVLEKIRPLLQGHQNK